MAVKLTPETPFVLICIV